jgi:hypothetical protein
MSTGNLPTEATRVFEEMKRRAVSAPPHVKQRVWREWDRTVLQMIWFMRMGHNYQGAPPLPDSLYAIAAEAGLVVMEALLGAAIAARARGGGERECVEAMADAIDRLFTEAGADLVMSRYERRKHHYLGWEEKYLLRRTWSPTTRTRI